MNILVVAAHPDDEVLGAGATIARHGQQGDKVTVAILGEGISSRYSSREQASMEAKDLIASLYEYANIAAKILRINHLQLLKFPDNRFDSIDFLEIVKRVEQIVDSVDPDIVYTHFWGDLNIDHSITSRAVLTACRPLPESRVKRILAFETPSATGWGTPSEIFVPNLFVNIEATLDLKIKAMLAYQSECRAFPHPRSSEALTARAKSWGAISGFKAAEPFILIRELMP